MIEIKDLERGRGGGYPGGSNLITRVLKKGAPFPALVRRLDGWQGERSRLAVSGFEDGGRQP